MRNQTRPIAALYIAGSCVYPWLNASEKFISESILYKISKPRAFYLGTSHLFVVQETLRASNYKQVILTMRHCDYILIRNYKVYAEPMLLSKHSGLVKELEQKRFMFSYTCVWWQRVLFRIKTILQKLYLQNISYFENQALERYMNGLKSTRNLTTVNGTLTEFNSILKLVSRYFRKRRIFACYSV